jgi:Ca2+-binding RTX toxin-like protein
MKARLLIPLIIAAAAALPSSALAGTATYDGSTFSFTADPGEINHIGAKRTTSCGGLASPCLSVYDLYTMNAPPGCDEIFAGVVCPIPSLVFIDAGDGGDVVNDWDGPSIIFGGTGGDVIHGNGGDDSLAGEEGVDAVVGGPGNDYVSGGPGDDWLESDVFGTAIDAELGPQDSYGRDTLAGGPGNDTADYEYRADPLDITLDDAGNDGAPGEDDNVASDVEIVDGGEADDTVTGNAGANVLNGLQGDDTLSAGDGDDTLDGGQGNDAVLGEDGTDILSGGSGDDIVDGGSGPDHMYGEYVTGCGIEGCVGGSDELRARDGFHDVIDCGYATDLATLDQFDELLDAWDCELVDRAQVAAGDAAPAPAPAGPAPAKQAPARPRGDVACNALASATRTVCHDLARAVARCHAGRTKAARKRCASKAVKRANTRCRAQRKKARRKACLRSVRVVAKRAR